MSLPMQSPDTQVYGVAVHAVTVVEPAGDTWKSGQGVQEVAPARE